MDWNRPDHNNKETVRTSIVSRVVRWFKNGRRDRSLIIFILSALVLAVAIWLASGLVLVQSGTRVLVLHWGQPSRLLGSGLHWHMPYPVDQLEFVRVDAARQVEIGFRGDARDRVLPEARMLTRDNNLVDIAFTVSYQVTDASDWLLNARAPQMLIRDAAEDAMRDTVGQLDLDALATDKLTRPVMAALQKAADSRRLGVTIKDLTLIAIQMPEPVQVAADAVEIAKQDSARAPDEARVKADQELEKAQQAATATVETARQTARQTLDAANQDAARFNDVLQNAQHNPAFARDQIYLETMHALMGGADHVVVDLSKHNDPIEVRFNNDKPATPAATPKPQVTPKAPSTDVTDWRSRDSFRSRERETR